MKTVLYPFQEEGFRQIAMKNGNVLLADEVGLGKTIETLAYLERHPNALPALVVCPGALRVNWAREVEAKTHLTAAVVSPKSTLKALEKTGVRVSLPDSIRPANVTIASYETLVDVVLEKVEVGKKKVWRPKLHHPFLNFKTLILDEAQAIKEESSARSKACYAMALLVEHVLALTGTPLMSRPREVWNIGRTVRRGLNWPSFFEFAKRFCAAHQMKIRVRGGHEKYVWNFDGASNLDELNTRLRKSIMIRRTKEEVELELPEKIRMTIPLQMGNSKAFDEAMESLKRLVAEKRRFKAEVAELNIEIDGVAAVMARHAEKAAKSSKLKTREKRGNDTEHTILGEISRLRKEVALAKVPAAVEYIATLAESDAVVVFAHHHEVIDALHRGLHNSDVVKTAVIDGRTNAADRQRRVDLFQEGKLQILILGILAAGSGLTLTKSANSVLVELPWRPGDLEQATGRVHRIGQKRGVTEHILFAAGTIEEQIIKMLDAKRAVTAVATGSADLVASEESILEAVMNF